MRYPQFLKDNGTIGLVSPSLGVSGFPYEERFEYALKKFESKGYKFKKCDHLYGIEKAVSTDAKTRAEEFMKMYLDDDVDFISSVAGGEFMMEILPYIDFELIKKSKPKFFMGISDNTNLVFTLPILADTAAIYGHCFGSFGMRRWYKSLSESYSVMTGKQLTQSSYPKHEKVDWDYQQLDALEGYRLTEKTVCGSLSGKDEKFSGRLIGGCLDILTVLASTEFAKVDEYLEKYKEDGFVWFLECCDLNALSQKRALWQLKHSGWFKYCKGIIYGRPLHQEDTFGVSVMDCLNDVLADLNVPVVYGCDFGHVAPSWTIISGAIGHVELTGGKATISYELK